MKGVVVFALFLFIIFVLKNKAEFSEKIAKGGPDKEISQIAVTGNDEIVQKFKATYDNIQSFTFMIDRNQSYKRAGSISVNIKDSKGKSVYHVTKDLLDVDGMRNIQPTLKTSKVRYIYSYDQSQRKQKRPSIVFIYIKGDWQDI